MVVAEISMWLHFSTYNLILSLNWTQMPSWHSNKTSSLPDLLYGFSVSTHLHWPLVMTGHLTKTCLVLALLSCYLLDAFYKTGGKWLGAKERRLCANSDWKPAPEWWVQGCCVPGSW
jgi:hypothetical protein